jgi:ABC-type branched-subunit amino acid transport system ATPase component
MDEPLLEVDDVHAGYGPALVLKGVELAVNDGEIVCVIGPNGAGKSTAFRCIYGLLTPTRGDVRHRGESILGRTPRELINRGITYILQRDAVFPDMTVRENLEIGAFAAERDLDVDARIEEMFDVFPVLRDRAKADASALSGGQRQMLEFARGLMTDPDLLLLDEPTAGLAPKVIDDVFEKVVDINERGVTILMIEQNIKTGLNYADRAYVLEDGQTRFSGSADSVLDDPQIREAYLGETVSYDQ